MSLTSWIEDAQVRVHLDAITPKLEPFNPRLVVKHVGGHAQTIGTAFDYALRIELRRLHPSAVHETLVAELAPMLMSGHPVWDRCATEYALTRRSVETYVRQSTVAPEDRARMARSSVQHAHLDVIKRAGPRGPDVFPAVAFLEPSSDEVEQVLQLLDRVPFKHFAPPLFLNPTFGPYSVAVGGADADVITGETLVDIKTTSDPAQDRRRNIRQLIGYFLLSRWQRLDCGPEAPEIDALEIYYSRQARFLRLEVAEILRAPSFKEHEHALRKTLARGPLRGATLTM